VKTNGRGLRGGSAWVGPAARSVLACARCQPLVGVGARLGVPRVEAASGAACRAPGRGMAGRRGAVAWQRSAWRVGLRRSVRRVGRAWRGAGRSA
jgi:hypothetical protein